MAKQKFSPANLTPADQAAGESLARAVRTWAKATFGQAVDATMAVLAAVEVMITSNLSNAAIGFYVAQGSGKSAGAYAQRAGRFTRIVRRHILARTEPRKAAHFTLTKPSETEPTKYRDPYDAVRDGFPLYEITDAMGGGRPRKGPAESLSAAVARMLGRKVEFRHGKAVLTLKPTTNKEHGQALILAVLPTLVDQATVNDVRELIGAEPVAGPSA